MHEYMYLVIYACMYVCGWVPESRLHYMQHMIPPY